jgi:hypothetical protein
MATWKKVVVSGSAISQLTNDSNYQTLAQVLTITSSLSSSASTARDAIAGDITSLSSSAHTSREAIVASVSGAFDSPSSSFATRVTDLEAFSSSLDATYATEAELDAATGSLLTTASAAANIITFTKGDGSTFNVEVGTSGSVATASFAQTVPYSGVLDKPTLVSASAFSSTAQGTLSASINGVATIVDLGLETTDSPTFAALTTTGNVTIGGDLNVDGTTTTINSTNLLVADRFALFASGSTTATDGGFIVQADVNGDGRAFGYDASADRWSLQTVLNSTGSAFTSVDAYVNTVEQSTSDPSANPVYGGATGYGAMHINTSTGDAFIFA